MHVLYNTPTAKMGTIAASYIVTYIASVTLSCHQLSGPIHVLLNNIHGLYSHSLSLYKHYHGFYKHSHSLLQNHSQLIKVLYHGLYNLIG